MTEGNLPGRLLVFRVGTLVCATEVEQVREILPRLPTTRIPGAPPVVAGLVNVRGTLVTVVEGWRALGQAPQAPPSTPPSTTSEESAEAEGSTIILEIATGAEGDGEKRVIGFTVDAVTDMLAGSDTTLEDRTGLPGVDPTLVRAVGRRNGELFIVLDMPALVGPVLLT